MGLHDRTLPTNNEYASRSERSSATRSRCSDPLQFVMRSEER